jgi:hypothetical protein
MHTVTPEFLTGAPVRVDLGEWQYEWRRQQNLTGLERAHTRERRLINQTIDSAYFFNWSPGACSDNHCSAVQQGAMNTEYYQRTMNASECLTTYSSVDGDRSDVIFVSNFDYLFNSSSSVPHVAQNGSTLMLVDDASKFPHPLQNSLLYAKIIPNVMAVGLWHDYYWLCGATNSFDCEYIPCYETGKLYC